MPELKRFAGAFATCLVVALGGCVGDGSEGESASGAVIAPAKAAKPGQEVETPEAFSLTDSALWDGRPSLGGIWVAHASVKDPERVIIRNLDNGKSIRGALFRRERDFPGPSIQMSSEAATALGVLAGQPVKVSIVAMRRAPEPKPEPAPEKGEIDQSALDVAATAGAAIDRATGAVRPTERPKGAKAATTAAPAAAATAVPEKPAKAAPESKPEAKPEAKAEAKPAAKPESKPKAKPETAAQAPAAGAPLSGVLEQPYVQIGTFSSEENAKRAALDLSKKGMPAVVRMTGKDAQTVWRVIVGPALSAQERDALLKKLKDAGYPDAYPVKG